MRPPSLATTTNTIRSTRQQTLSLQLKLIVQFIANYAILFGAHLIAVQIRLKLPWGNRLGAEYNAQPVGFMGVLGLALFGAYLIAGAGHLLKINPLVRQIGMARQFRVLLLAIGLAYALTVLLLPDVSGLQLFYFGIAAVVLGISVILWPRSLNPNSDIYARLARLWESRFLLLLWLRYNIEARYSQTLLGILWIVMLPLTTSAVLALAFSAILQIADFGAPFICFLLSGFVAWGIFNQGIIKGIGAVSSQFDLINQVYFPRETLVILALGEALVDFAFTFVAMLAVNALNNIWPNIYFVYLPGLILLLACFTLGLMLFVSCLSIMVRDLAQLISVALQLVFYLTPLLYPLEKIPPQFQVIVLLNPMVSVIQAFHDVIVYNRAPDMVTLYYPLVASIALLYMGYAFFKRHEEGLADLK